MKKKFEDLTEIEILMAAAKVAGIKHYDYNNGYDGSHGLIMIDSVGREIRMWNPLNDASDAFRLQVKLKMVVDVEYNGGAVAGTAYIGFDNPEFGYQSGLGEIDLYSATRRAIVLAAVRQFYYNDDY
jgi:hypothetical protein